MELKYIKQIYDPIHGYIKISNIACQIIDTKEFQRLRYLHQTGTCYFVFPSATNSRFEHSIGTYHLCGLILNSIKRNNTKKELNEYIKNIDKLEKYYKTKTDDNLLDEYIIELIKIAGLCHDLGHGPFSHVFDDVFIPTIKNQKGINETHENEIHEIRSINILKIIIKKNPELSKFIGEDEIEFIGDLIYPKKHNNGFLYQIVSNNLNSIDVDKYDYINRDVYNIGLKYNIQYDRLIEDIRVIDNIICYPENSSLEIISIFQTRYRLHRQIYNHKAVIATQFMINEIMLNLDSILNIYESIFDLEKFCLINDTYIFSILEHLYINKKDYNEEKQKLIMTTYDIWNKINNRDIYKLITTIVSTDININIKKKIEDIIEQNISKEDRKLIVLFETKIGLIGGNKHPFKNIYFYKTKNLDKVIILNESQVGLILPEKHKELLLMIFIKDKNRIDLEDKLHNLICK